MSVAEQRSLPTRTRAESQDSESDDVLRGEEGENALFCLGGNNHLWTDTSGADILEFGGCENTTAYSRNDAVTPIT